MNKEVIIEPIGPQNFDAFLSLIDQLALYEKLTPTDDDAKRRLRNDGLSKNPKYEAYIGRVDATYIGYFIFFMTYSSLLAKPTLYIEDFYVVQEYRKKGIGQKFLTFLVSLAKERNCGRIEWQVLKWNQPGITFYKKNKAQHLSDWWFYRLTDDQFDEILQKEEKP